MMMIFDNDSKSDFNNDQIQKKIFAQKPESQFKKNDEKE